MTEGYISQVRKLHHMTNRSFEPISVWVNLKTGYVRVNQIGLILAQAGLFFDWFDFGSVSFLVKWRRKINLGKKKVRVGSISVSGPLRFIYFKHHVKHGSGLRLVLLGLMISHSIINKN